MSAPGGELAVFPDPTDPGHDTRIVVDSGGRAVFAGAAEECDRYVRAIDNGHTQPWAVTIGYWGGR